MAWICHRFGWICATCKHPKYVEQKIMSFMRIRWQIFLVVQTHPSGNQRYRFLKVVYKATLGQTIFAKWARILNVLEGKKSFLTYKNMHFRWSQDLGQENWVFFIYVFGENTFFLAINKYALQICILFKRLTHDFFSFSVFGQKLS